MSSSVSNAAPEKMSGNAPAASTEATTAAPTAKETAGTAPGAAAASSSNSDPVPPSKAGESTAPVESEPAAAAAAAPAPVVSKPPPAPEVDSEDDLDDLDDLDDMLDEFEAPPPVAPAPASKAKASASAAAPLDEEWAKQLQAGMADLLNDMTENEEMQAQFDALAKELNDAMASASLNDTPAPGAPSLPKPAAPSTATAATAPADPADFQAQIKAAMDRMKSSEADVNAAVQDAESDDFLAEMLKQLQSGAGAGGEEDFSGMLVNMMEQLTSKEILYEPMKELCDKYPEWLEKNKGKEKEDDMKRYREQYVVVKEIVDKFEEKGYKDENEADREYIVERMQKMQSAGAPPTELMGDVPPELGLPDDIDPDCGVQ